MNSHALPTVPVYTKNRIALLLCIFETTISTRYLPIGLDNENVAHNMVGLANGDVADNINPDVCFLTKANCRKFETE